MCFLWRRELIKHWHSAQHTCDTVDTQPVRLNFIDTQQTSDRYSNKVDEMASSEARAILAKYHRISMEEIFAQVFALCTTYIDTEPVRLNFHQYSRTHEMNSSDARAILAQIPFDFYGGEICVSVRTLHNIHHTQPVRLNFHRYSPTKTAVTHGIEECMRSIPSLLHSESSPFSSLFCVINFKYLFR
jgi:hypothetical protein